MGYKTIAVKSATDKSRIFNEKFKQILSKSCRLVINESALPVKFRREELAKAMSSQRKVYGEKNSMASQRKGSKKKQWITNAKDQVKEKASWLGGKVKMKVFWDALVILLTDFFLYWKEQQYLFIIKVF